MRAVKICVPKDRADRALDLIFSLGVARATANAVDTYTSPGAPSSSVIIDIETSTPMAKKIADAVLASDFFDTKECSISTRQPRAIVSSEKYSDITVPWVEPAIDICQELWQFSHITAGFAVRVLIAGGLLAFGIINQQLLMMIAGMLFLPLLPVLLAIGFGSWTRQWGLVTRALTAIGLALTLLIVAGIMVAAFSHPPVKYNEFNSLPVSLVISVAVGIAAAVANTDDGGRRELIGLAATAQIAVIPVWLGVCLVLGFPEGTSRTVVWENVLVLVLNLVIVTSVSLGTYVVLNAIGHPTASHSDHH